LQQQANILADRILAVDHVLNAFGCVSTTHHEQASRVGRFIELTLATRSGQTLGAHVGTFLLDSRLVTSTRDGEGNFRILHGLCAKAKQDIKLRRWLKLGPLSEFRWLSGGAEAEPEDGAETVDRFTHSLLLFDFSVDMINEVLRLLAGILHLGNVTFGAQAKVRCFVSSNFWLLEHDCVGVFFVFCAD
jgi:myosin heavy subunit